MNIEHLHFDKTYSGVYSLGDIFAFNHDFIGRIIPEKIEREFGADRPVKIVLPEIYDYNYFLPVMMYTAWVDRFLDEDDPRHFDENGDMYHGHYLILVGFMHFDEFSNDPLKRVKDDIEKYFDENCKGYYF